MRQITIYIVFLLLVTSTGFSQELPENFKKEIRKQYLIMSEEVKQNELNLTFEEYLNRRIQSYRTKQKYYSSITGSRSVNGICDNGTFENGDVNIGDWNFYWEGDGGTISGVNRLNSGSFNTGGSHNAQVHHSTVPIGVDPYFGSLSRVWNFPSGNTTSLRLGNANDGCGLESIAKVVTITPSNALFTFSYAMVMDNPVGHGNALPFFEVNIIDATTTSTNYNNLINLGNSSNRISSNNPLLIPNDTNANRRWKDWTCVTSDLSSLIGQTVIIEFVNRDCWACGHWSYTYIDNICLSCEGANGDEGSVTINQSQSSDCEIPGQICIDYTLPNGNNPTLDLELQIIQNGTTLNTLNSPTLSSGNSYCFNLTALNTNGVNLSLLKFDYKVIGRPTLNGFNLTPKTIGTSSYGVNLGVNNDYDIFCPPNTECCQTDLAIWNPDDGQQHPSPVQTTGVNGIDLSYSEEIFEIHQDASIPITELRVNIQDIEFQYNYEQCAECINNPSLWGSIYSPDNTIGTAPRNLTQNPSFTLGNFAHNVTNGKNTREIVWENPNGAMLKSGDNFKVGYILPPLSEIPCCATNVKICSKISWKDANCNICEIYTCSDIDLSNKITSLKINSEANGCCERVLTADSDAPATYLWSTGETTKSITVTNNGTYSVNASTGSSSFSQMISINDIPAGSFPLLTHPTKIYPIGSIGNDKLYISNPNLPANALNAYNANKYRLWIFNRWGELIREIEDEECNGFKNFSIHWDGKDKYGNYVQGGTYEWRFFVQNCTYKNYTQIEFNTVEKYCKRRFLGICLSWDRRAVNKLLTVGEVTVVR